MNTFLAFLQNSVHSSLDRRQRCRRNTRGLNLEHQNSCRSQAISGEVRFRYFGVLRLSTKITYFRGRGVLHLRTVGRGQNTDPQSMDCLNGLPKWTTPESHLKGEKQLFEGLGLGLWSETNGSHVWNVSKANA